MDAVVFVLPMFFPFTAPIVVFSLVGLLGCCSFCGEVEGDG